MKNLKFISFAIALLMILSIFAGCGNTKNNGENTPKSNTNAGENNIVDSNEIINDDGEKFTVNVTATGEIKKGAVDISGNQFELEEHTYSFPIKMSELFDNGWNLSNGYDYQTEFEGNSTTNLVSYYLIHKNGTKITLDQLHNEATETKDIKDCTLTGFQIDSYGVENGSSFVAPGGITLNSNAKDVLSVFGNPNKAKDFKGDSYNLDDQLTYLNHSISNISYSFTFDDEDGSMYSIHISYEK